MSLHRFYGRLKMRLPRGVRRAAMRARVAWESAAATIPGVQKLRRTYAWWRIGGLPTRLLGPRYRRSRRFIEIDITYTCNLRCPDCNRSCAQLPGSEAMSLGQIERFLEESRERGLRWERIRLLGGEPSLHPEFLGIVRLVVGYRDEFSPETTIEVGTNGFGPRVAAALADLPAGVVVVNTLKLVGPQAGFASFNLAPADLPEYARADFSNGCFVPEYCGMALTPYGYYPCGVAGGIDRVFGFDLGRKTLPAANDDMLDVLRRCCRLCGHFKIAETSGTGTVWKAAYARAKAKPSRLARFPESGESQRQALPAVIAGESRPDPFGTTR